MQDFAIGKYTLFISIPFSLSVFSQIEKKKLLERIGRRHWPSVFFPAELPTPLFAYKKKRKEKKPEWECEYSREKQLGRKGGESGRRRTRKKEGMCVMSVVQLSWGNTSDIGRKEKRWQ